MNPRKKKILFFIATLAQGGAERLISELSLRLRDFEVVIVISENSVSYPFAGKLIVLGVPFPQDFFSKIYCSFLRFIRLRKVVAKEEPDYVVSFGAFANMLNVFLPTKVLLHTDTFYSTGRRDIWFLVLRIFARFFYNRAASIIPMSQIAALDLVQNYGVQKEKIRVIYNPIDIKKIEQLSKEPISAAFQELFSHPVIIAVGRFSKEKGQWHAIKAFKEFKAAVPDAKLVIVGEGGLENDFRALAQNLHIARDVHFVGWQDNPFRLLARAAIFVLPSYREGLPSALLEAMACGLPVISSDCKSGPREILAPASNLEKEARDIEIADFGILVPPFGEKFSFSQNLTKEEKVLAAALKALYQDPSLMKKLGESAKKRAKDFDSERILKNWNFLLDMIDSN